MVVSTKEKPEKAKAGESQDAPQEHPPKQPQEAITAPPQKKAPKDPRDSRIEELTDILKRLQAEFENFRKWTDKENVERAKFANAHLIAKFLPLLDTLDAALKSQQQDTPSAKGLQLVHAQLLALLSQEGLAPIDSAGRKFDPHFHEVMLREPSQQEEGTILEEFQKGYVLHGKVLRHSKVKIAGK